ncbi:VOC family protein [Bifidobacterium ruminantium]|uniref:VOC family protein n=1 Tax=Bifidobacterium ruminantium TaxID=78346 RepID=UPI00255CA7A6|nr:VOC family protein [Bifidobacterium ruminantium]
MSKPMTAFTTDFQHSGMIAKDLDETIEFYTKKLGFEVAGIFHNGENRCAFLRYGHLTIETWEGEPAPMTTGAINHWAFDTPDIEAAFENAKELGLKFKDTEIQHIDSFWDHGIRYRAPATPRGAFPDYLWGPTPLSFFHICGTRQISVLQMSAT